MVSRLDILVFVSTDTAPKVSVVAVVMCDAVRDIPIAAHLDRSDHVFKYKTVFYLRLISSVCFIVAVRDWIAIDIVFVLRYDDLISSFCSVDSVVHSCDLIRLLWS